MRNGIAKRMLSHKYQLLNSGLGAQPLTPVAITINPTDREMKYKHRACKPAILNTLIICQKLFRRALRSIASKASEIHIDHGAYGEVG